MRLGVFSDVHGNLPALEAVLRELERERVDRLVCLGDLVGYGPMPDGCVERVLSSGAATVAGNHDLMAVGRLDDDACTPLARETMRWTREAITDTTRASLEQLPPVARLPGVLCAHGTPEDPSVGVATRAAADARLARLPEGELLLVGHTHRALAHDARRGTVLRATTGRLRLEEGVAAVLNPGAVGQSREWSRDARYLVLDLDDHFAHFRSVAYDAAPVRQALVAAGLPPSAFHSRPPLVRAAGIRARALRAAAHRLR